MTKLKKIVLRIPLYPTYYEYYDLFERHEIIQIHRQDEEHIFVTQRVKFKDPKMNPKMLEGERYRMPYVEIIEENREKGEYVFFCTNKLIKETRELYDKLKDLILDPPMILDNDRLLVNIIIENKSVEEFFKAMDSLFDEESEILSISDLRLNYEDLFLKLTDRQKEIIYYAVYKGYFEIPRRIKAEKIALRFNITKSGFYDHLRKIDRTIYHSIFK